MSKKAETKPEQALSVEPARPAERADIEALLDEVATWLQHRGIDQWKPGQFGDELNEAISSGQLHVARQRGVLIGCFLLTKKSPPAVKRWLAEHRRNAQLSGYLSRLAVARQWAGQDLGIELLDAACGLTADEGLEYLRLDCWAGNRKLRQYYLDAGFTHCADIQTRSRDRKGEVISISLFERLTSSVRSK